MILHTCKNCGPLPIAAFYRDKQTRNLCRRCTDAYRRTLQRTDEEVLRDLVNRLLAEAAEKRETIATQQKLIARLIEVIDRKIGRAAIADILPAEGIDKVPSSGGSEGRRH